jgi:CubicO group peptidase (beta-lactamase class C family)
MNMDFTAVSALVKNAVKDGAFPCAAFAAGLKDEVIYEGCAGMAGDEPVTGDSLFDLASVTKIVVPATLSMLLLEKGLISLHEPIQEFLDDVPEDKAGITIKHLLTHTSGIKAHMLLQETAQSPPEAVESILKTELSAPVGTATEYSCLGFILLGKILEKVTGEELDILAKKYILDPLGMQNSGYNPKKGHIIPTEYDKETGRHLTGAVHDENARFLGGVSANAGLFSSLTDMKKYCAMLSRNGMAGNTPFVSKAVLELYKQNYTPGMSESRGLGFSLNDGRAHALGDLFPVGSYGHTGFTGTCFFVDIKTGLYVILLTNRVFYGRENNKIMHFRRRFHNAIYGEFSKSGC